MFSPSRGSWLLVPTERHVEALAESGRDARTLRRLTRELARAEEPALEPATPEITRLLTSEIVGCSMEQARGIDDSLGKLRRAGTRASTLANIDLPRARLFAGWLASADSRLKACALRDDRAAAWAAAEQLARVHDVAGLPRGSCLVRGLARWDNATLRLLEALHARLRARGNDGVTIELPRSPLPFLQAAIDALSGTLETRWASHNDAPNLLFSEAQSLQQTPVELIEAHDAASEARAVARAALQAVAEGLPLDRIAIVPTDLSEAFLEPLRFELARAKLPFAEPRGRPAIAAPRTHAALELLQLARGPLSRDALVDILRVPGLNWESWFGAHFSGLPQELSRLPLRVERAPGELLQELSLRAANNERPQNERQLERAAGLQQGLARLLRELEQLGRPAPRSQHSRRALELFDRIGMLEPSLAALTLGVQRVPELLAGMGHDAIAASALRTAAERTAAAAVRLGLGESAVPFARWLEELELALEGVGEGRGAARAAAVRIARPSDVAGLDCDCLILCRASDQSLDRTSSIDPALGGDLELALRKLEPAGTGANEQQFAQLTLAAVLGRARRLVVTWARHDENATLAPSRLARALGRSAPVHSEPASALSPRARRVVPVRALSPTALARQTHERARIAFYADPGAPSGPFTGAAGPLTPFFGEQARPLAVTLLERALGCRFLAFAGRVLGAVRADTVSDAVGFKERGSLVHEALAAALLATQGQWGTLANDVLLERAQQAARAVLERRGFSPLRRVGLESTQRDVNAMLAWIFRHREELSFRSAETPFGEREGWPALALGGHRLSGRIDRIDITSDGRRARVVDYKTRKSSAKSDDSKLQPWLYAQKVGLELGVEQIEFSYVSLDGRRPSERVVYSGALDGPAIGAAYERSDRLLRLLESGNVVPRPDSAGLCARCEARDLCRRPLSAPEASEDE